MTEIFRKKNHVESGAIKAHSFHEFNDGEKFTQEQFDITDNASEHFEELKDKLESEFKDSRAQNILSKGAAHMQDRAATYDKEGERSIPSVVKAFEAITGHSLTNEQGWLFMALLKMVRTQKGDYRADNYEDLAAYSALMGEQAFDDKD